MRGSNACIREDVLSQCANRMDPTRPNRPWSIPTPIEFGALQCVAPTGSVVIPSGGGFSWQGNLPRFFLDKPTAVRICRLFSRRIAFHQKGGPLTDLRYRRIDAKVPHRGRQRIRASLEQRRQIESFVSPVRQIAARRTIPDTLPVQIQHEPVVRAHVNYKVLGNHLQFQRLLKMQRDWLPQWRRWMADPLRFPVLAHWRWSHLRYRSCYETEAARKHEDPEAKARKKGRSSATQPGLAQNGSPISRFQASCVAMPRPEPVYSKIYVY